MVRRLNNQLPNNLLQLQNLIKRDPPSYEDEFMLQHRHYKSLLQLFWLNPSQLNKNLEELTMFIAQVSHCYSETLSDFAQELISLLKTHNTVLDPDMRMVFCRALILLRNKNQVQPTDLLSLFFQLLRCNDKSLRDFLQSHIVTDIKNLNAKQKNTKLNTTLQNFMFSMVKDNNPKAAKLSLDIMVDLYKKHIWNDTKTVNVIATACFSKVTKVVVTALKFFLSCDNPKQGESDSDSEDEPNPKEVMMANKVNKKTRKREKQLKKVKQLVQKSKKKKSAAPVYNFSALHLVHDSQGFAEKLFRQLETTTNERFEVRLMTLDVISRLIGLHHLILLNFYPYIQKFLQPHQKEVTKLLVYTAQACHELVPPDVLEPVLRTLVNNFVTERNSSDVMAVGLNAVREMCSRNPLVMNADLLRDLVQYKSYRERSVMMAARSLIHLFRHTLPTMLHKKDRGRPSEASIQLIVKNFGEVDVADHVPGAEVLLEQSQEKKHLDDCSSESENESWIDVSHSKDEEDEVPNLDKEESSKKVVTNNMKYKKKNAKSSKKNKKWLKSNDNKTKEKDHCNAGSTNEAIELKKKQAAEVSLMRILTDEDFKEIDAALIRKQVEAPKKGIKRKLDEDAAKSTKELVSLTDIENIYKKRKHDKQTRVESVKRGQEGREKFGYKDNRLNPFSSKTNREKNKNKNFMMIKHKVRGKTKRSFKDKQVALRNYLIKQKKMR